jgi:hypothetical protein
LSKIAAAAYICFQVIGPTHCYQEYSITWVCEIVDLWLAYSDTSILTKKNLKKDGRKKFKFNNWIAEYSPSQAEMTNYP